MSLTNGTEEGIGDITKVKEVEQMKIHFVHTFLSHRIDNAKLKNNIRKGSNVTQL